MQLFAQRSIGPTYYKRVFKNNRKNIRAVWNHIKTLKGELSVSPPRPTSDPVKLNYCFANLRPNAVKKLPLNCENFLNNVPYCSHCFKLEDACADEIKRFCCTLKPKKSVVQIISLHHYCKK